MATAFGIGAMSRRSRRRLEQALQQLLDAPGPTLLHVAIDQAANVWPLVPPNHNNAQMLDADEVASLPLADASLSPESEEARHALSA